MTNDDFDDLMRNASNMGSAEGSEEPLTRETAPRLPREPYALFPSDGQKGPEGFHFLIHKEISSEAQCILLFESIVDAFAIAEQYKTATGKDAEPQPVEVRGFEERFSIQFFPADGNPFQCSVRDYIENME